MINFALDKDNKVDLFGDKTMFSFLQDLYFNGSHADKNNAYKFMIDSTTSEQQ